jgi:hypothetical protein
MNRAEVAFPRERACDIGADDIGSFLYLTVYTLIPSDYTNTPVEDHMAPSWILTVT